MAEHAGTRFTAVALTALCTSLPARAGIIVIGNEGAVVVGRARRGNRAGLATASLPVWVCLCAMALASMICGGVWIAVSVALQHYRGVSAVIAACC